MKTLDLVGSRRWLFLGSGIAVLVALVLLAIPPTLRPGIEFTAGTTALLRFEGRVDQSELRDAYAGLGHDEARIQSTGPNEFLIRTRQLEIPEGSFNAVAPRPNAAPVGPMPLPVLGTVRLGADGAGGEVMLRRPFGGDLCNFGDVAARLPAGTEATVHELHEECADGDAGGAVYRVEAGGADGYVLVDETHDFVAAPAQETPTVDQGERTVIERALADRFGAFDVVEFDSVSAVVSKVAVRNAAAALVVASLFIMGYIAFAFSSMPSPFRYAAAAIIALVHDVLIVLGAFSLFGKVFGTEINLMFVTGLLTVIGFSVHDSIVVFDRVRENISLAPDAPLRQNVNAALLQTLARSLNTSVTLVFTVLALLLLGGVTIRPFLLVILVGVVAGTYSSVGIAAQLLVAWQEGDFGRWLSRLLRRGHDHEETAPA